MSDKIVELASTNRGPAQEELSLSEYTAQLLETMAEGLRMGLYGEPEGVAVALVSSDGDCVVSSTEAHWETLGILEAGKQSLYTE